jgi:hypothetical protein
MTRLTTFVGAFSTAFSTAIRAYAQQQHRPPPLGPASSTHMYVHNPSVYNAAMRLYYHSRRLCTQMSVLPTLSRCRRKQAP